MVGRYELVAVNSNNDGIIIPTKTGKKLSLYDADLFTGLFNNKDELSYYLCTKGYISFNPEKYVLVYCYNKKNRYLDCIYKNDKNLITLAKLYKNKKTNITNDFFNYLVSYLIKNENSELVEYAYYNKYITKYLYEKLTEYKNTKYKYLIKNIKNELSKEYLQIRRLYMLIKLKETNKQNISNLGKTLDLKM